LRITKIFRAGLKYIFLLFLAGFSSQICVSQSITRINLSEIPQRKVRNYIISESIDKMDDYSSIHASWKKNIDKSHFNLIEKSFLLNYDLSDVWDFYRHANILEMWNGKTVRFGVLISKPTNTIINSYNSSFHEIDTGDVYFLNLKLLKGILNVEVAFEIITIDLKQRIMEFSYIDNNKSLGKQTIQFFNNGPGKTKIVHLSYFKSKSSLRDKVFYPYFHKKFIREFHKNMSSLIERKRLPFTILK
jgi:hypothetical protein